MKKWLIQHRIQNNQMDVIELKYTMYKLKTPLERYKGMLETRKVKLKTSRQKIYKQKHREKKEQYKRQQGTQSKNIVIKVLDGKEREIGAMYGAEKILAKNDPKLVKDIKPLF